MKLMGVVDSSRWYSQSKSEYRRSTDVVVSTGGSPVMLSATEPALWFHVAVALTVYRMYDDTGPSPAL
jgi:hypothetical protein